MHLLYTSQHSKGRRLCLLSLLYSCTMLGTRAEILPLVTLLLLLLALHFLTQM